MLPHNRVHLNIITWTYSRQTGLVIFAQWQEDEMGVIRPSGLLRFEADAQDLKSCEGFPREGSSPSPGTMESIGYENPVFSEKAKIGVL